MIDYGRLKRPLGPESYLFLDENDLANLCFFEVADSVPVEESNGSMVRIALVQRSHKAVDTARSNTMGQKASFLFNMQTFGPPIVEKTASRMSVNELYQLVASRLAPYVRKPSLTSAALPAARKRFGNPDTEKNAFLPLNQKACLR